MGADEAIEDLPERQRQVVPVFAEHSIDAS
jgi:hypothetical protein